MTARHLVERGLQLLDVERETQVQAADVDDVVGAVLAVKDHAGLQTRERVSVL